MITYYFRTIKDEALKTITDLRSGVWIHVESPSDEALTELFEKLALDDSLIEDIQDFFEVPRMERSQGASFFFLRYPFHDKKEDANTAPLVIVMGESFVMTVAQRPVPQFEQFFNGKTPIFTTQKSKFFLQMMDVLTESFNVELIKLRKSVHKERSRLRKITTQDIERLVQYETKLNNIVDALVPTNAWLQKLTKGNQLQLYSDDVDLMQDLLIGNEQVVDSARSVLKMIQNIRGAIEAIMTSRLNNALRILTVITILLTVPLVIASLYGMNVALPLQEGEYTFWILISMNIFIIGVLSEIFRRNNWF